MSKAQSCVWCGSEIRHKEAETHRSCFCPECQTAYEAEAHRSLHPVEVRSPHND